MFQKVLKSVQRNAGYRICNRVLALVTVRSKPQLNLSDASGSVSYASPMPKQADLTRSAATDASRSEKRRSGRQNRHERGPIYR